MCDIHEVFVGPDGEPTTAYSLDSLHGGQPDEHKVVDACGPVVIPPIPPQPIGEEDYYQQPQTPDWVSGHEE